MSDRITARQADSSDWPRIAPLWEAFIRERAEHDRSLVLGPNPDFPRFLARELQAPNVSCWLVEHRTELAPEPSVVGCLIWYLDIEAVDDVSPFVARRCGKVLGLYVEPLHRGSGCAELLVDHAMRHARSLDITDIDVLVAAEQTGLHAILERKGLSPVAVQFTRHFAAERPPATASASAGRATRLGHRLLQK